MSYTSKVSGENSSRAEIQKARIADLCDHVWNNLDDRLKNKAYSHASEFPVKNSKVNSL